MYALPIRRDRRRRVQAGSGFGGAHGSSLPSRQHCSRWSARPPWRRSRPCMPCKARRTCGEASWSRLLRAKRRRFQRDGLHRVLAHVPCAAPSLAGCFVQVQHVLLYTPCMAKLGPRASTREPGSWEFNFGFSRSRSLTLTGQALPAEAGLFFPFSFFFSTVRVHVTQAKNP